MKVFYTSSITLASFEGKETERLWCYCGLDTMLTLEIFNAISPQLDNVTTKTYRFSMDLMGPVFYMNLRGIRVDLAERDRVVAAYSIDLRKIVGQLNEIFIDGLGVNYNWRSHPQLKELFYDVLGLPPVKKRNTKGEYAPTVDRDALEKLENDYFVARPLITHILGARDISKKISVLETDVDPDSRMRTSYNIGGTTTGRLSSSMSDFGSGGNLQNVEERLRKVFVADEGMKFAYIDLEQAESRAVGAIIWNDFHDGTYLDACESSDLHTYVARLAFPELSWNGDLKKDKEIAERPFYRQHSYRHMAKVLGHGSNYLGTPPTMQKHTKIDKGIIAEFQARYFTAFPCIPKWHKRVEQQVREHGLLTSLMNRRRHFFGRRNDAATVREAVAFDPQGSVADILNTGMLRVWRSGLCELLAQIHDALLVQYSEGDEDASLPKLLDLVRVPVELNFGRTLVIPSEAKIGFNWSSASPNNADGLIKFTLGRPDTRKRTKN